MRLNQSRVSILYDITSKLLLLYHNSLIQSGESFMYFLVMYTVVNPEKEGDPTRLKNYSVQSALLGGSGGMPPRKILNFRPSVIISGAVLGQNSRS